MIERRFPSSGLGKIALLGGVFVAGAIGGWNLTATSSDARDRRKAPGQEAMPAISLSPEDGREEGSEAHDFLSRLHLVLAIRNRDERERTIFKIADELDSEQIKDALERLARLRLPNRDEIISQLFFRWGAIAPEAALEFAGHLPETTCRKAAGAIVSGWMEVDSQAAKQWVETLPGSALKNEAWKAVLVAEAAGNPEAALDEASKRDMPWRMMEEVTHAIFDKWVLRDPAGAAARAAQIPDAGFKTEAIKLIGAQWAELDTAAAVAWASSLVDSVEMDDPGDAHSTYAGADRTNASRSILEVWLSRDAEGALEWLESLPDGNERISLAASAGFWNGEYSQDPERALRIASMLPEGEWRAETMWSFFDRWANVDPQAELAWLKERKDPELSRMSLSYVLRNLRGADLLGALDSAQKIAGVDATVLGEAIARRMSDPATVAAWAARQPNPGAFLEAAARPFAAEDAAQAIEWARTLPQAAQDATLGVIVEVALHNEANNFDGIAEWAAGIRDPEKRQSALVTLAESWIDRAPESGRAWLANAPLPQPVKDRLLHP